MGVHEEGGQQDSQVCPVEGRCEKFRLQGIRRTKEADKSKRLNKWQQNRVRRKRKVSSRKVGNRAFKRVLHEREERYISRVVESDSRKNESEVD